MYSVGVVLFQIHFPGHPGGGPVPGAIQVPDGSDHELKDLITALLDVEPSKRPTASSALLHPYFRQCYIDRLVNMGELVEQNKKLEAVRALLYRARIELDKDHPHKLEVVRSPADGNRALVLAMLDKYALRVAPTELARPLTVTFKGEAGVDQGGLLTEAYTLFFEGVVADEVGLFETAADSGIAAAATSARNVDFQYAKLYLPRVGATDPTSIMRLRGFGRLIVKCFFDGRRITAHFAPSLFKYICGVDVSIQVCLAVTLYSLCVCSMQIHVSTHTYIDTRLGRQDLQQFDPQAGTSVRWLLSATGVRDLGLDFEELGEPQKGRVTDQNKTEFARLKAHHVLVGSR